MTSQAIGKFQLENLVRNRIPFLLLNLGVDMTGTFPAFFQSYMESQMRTVEPASALEHVKIFSKDISTAIVVIGSSPIQAGTCAQDLMNAGYGNVYYLDESL